MMSNLLENDLSRLQMIHVVRAYELDCFCRHIIISNEARNASRQLLDHDYRWFLKGSLKENGDLIKSKKK